MARLDAALAVGALLAACTSSSIDSYPGLAQRIAEYYDLERQQKWEQAWTYRAPAYRQSVPLDRYTTIMSRDAQGWTLKDFKIGEVSRQGDLVRVKMEFVEVPPAKFGSVPMGELSTEDQSVWQVIDGKWHAWETGQRSHLSLNAAVVPPNTTVETDARKSGARGSP